VKEKDSLFSEFQELSINEHNLLKRTHKEKIGKMDFEMSQMEQRITLSESELAATKFDAANEAANEAAKHTSVTKLQNKIHELREIIEESKTNYTKLEDDYSQQLLVANRSVTLLQSEIDSLTTSLQDADTEKLTRERKLRKLKTKYLK